MDVAWLPVHRLIENAGHWGCKGVLPPRTGGHWATDCPVLRNFRGFAGSQKKIEELEARNDSLGRALEREQLRVEEKEEYGLSRAITGRVELPQILGNVRKKTRTRPRVTTAHV